MTVSSGMPYTRSSVDQGKKTSSTFQGNNKSFGAGVVVDSAMLEREKLVLEKIKIK